MKIKMNVLNADGHVEMASQMSEQGASFKELIREAYIQGMIDKEIESMEQLDGGEYVCNLVESINDHQIEANIITWDAFTS
ncbi:MAG: hypothetical protein H8E98_03810 [Bacteroidetes bacterium]|nr:hypothetical protein [Bacteroidota bacterium]